MKKLFVLPTLLLSLLFAQPAHAVDVWVGTVASGSSLTVGAGFRVAVQCDVSAYVQFAGSTATAASSKSVKVSADALYDAGRTTYAANTVFITQDSVAASCKVFVQVGGE